MKEQAMKYLEMDRILNIDLIVALNMGAEILHFDEDGIFLKSIDNVYMMTCSNIDKAKQWLDTLSNLDIFVTHQKEYVDILKNKYHLTKEMIVNQCIYPKKTIEIAFVSDVTIQPLNATHFETIKKYYSTSLEDTYIIKQLEQPFFYGAFMGEKIVGFIGLHEEGSIGFLEVLPKYRGRGIAKYLETYLIDTLLKSNKIPYAQIKIENEVSFKLHEALGFLISKHPIIWLTK